MAASDIAATGMASVMVKMETEANNIANSKTTAFKREMVGFKDMIYQTPRPAGTPTATSGGSLFPTPIQLGTGVTVGSTYRDLTRGDPVQSQGPYDFYIYGEGYFQIQYPDGTTTYTRAGNFTLDDQRQVVTAEGYIVGNTALVIPQDAVDVVVNRQGEIWVTLAGQPGAPQQIGTINLITFPNPRGLEAIGENLYMETAASGGPIEGQPGTPGFGQILQSFLEESNVQIMTEMVGMIDSQLLHQVLAEVVKKDSARKEAEITISRVHG